MATLRWKVTELINDKATQTDNQIAVRKIKKRRVSSGVHCSPFRIYGAYTDLLWRLAT